MQGKDFKHFGSALPLYWPLISRQPRNSTWKIQSCMGCSGPQAQCF
jgi:hypothetical protein